MSITAEEVAAKAGVRDINQECSNDDLLELSRFCDPWQIVGQYLKLDRTQIDDIDRDNKTTDLKRLAVLQKWKETFPFNANYKVLVSALLSCRKVQQALEVCKILAKKQGKLSLNS